MPQRLDYQSLAPEGMQAFGAAHSYISSCGLPTELVDLVYLRVSQINGCAYCMEMHSRDLLKHGVPITKILLTSTWREAGDLFDARERAALQWVETVTLISVSHVPDDAFTKIRSVFDEKEVADLTIAIGLMNVLDRMAISFRVPPNI